MHCAADVKQAVTDAAVRLGPLAPDAVGVVAGTGLAGLADGLANCRGIALGDLPDVPQPSAPGHEGRLVVGELSGRQVALFTGRVHLYEGRSPAEVACGVRLLAGLGIRTLIVTNAAGALDPHFSAGGLMRITDHINLTGRNPLLGPNDDALGPRFPDMSRAYSPRLGALADQAACRRHRLERGIYAASWGRAETPAETRLLRSLGADAVDVHGDESSRPPPGHCVRALVPHQRQPARLPGRSLHRGHSGHGPGRRGQPRPAAGGRDSAVLTNAGPGKTLRPRRAQKAPDGHGSPSFGNPKRAV